jgi:tight adherence protein B
MFGYAGAVLMVFGLVTSVTMAAVDPNGSLRRNWALYERAVDREVRFQFWRQWTGAQIARSQAVFVVLFIALAAVTESWYVGLEALLVALAPMFILKYRHRKRVEKIEEQLPSWLLLLANALKATPAVGQAISFTTGIVRPPIQEDLDLTLKEFDLGAPIDQAVLNMANRIESPIVASALATLLVARQTGGELPRTLEESAAALREMQRLEGVVRTKTAEGKAQAWVLGAMPFVLLLVIYQVDPHWWDPMTNSTLGYILLVIAGFLWIAAIFLARKILQVDI